MNNIKRLVERSVEHASGSMDRDMISIGSIISPVIPEVMIHSDGIHQLVFVGGVPCRKHPLCFLHN